MTRRKGLSREWRTKMPDIPAASSQITSLSSERLHWRAAAAAVNCANCARNELQKRALISFRSKLSVHRGGRRGSDAPRKSRPPSRRRKRSPLLVLFLISRKQSEGGSDTSTLVLAFVGLRSIRELGRKERRTRRETGKPSPAPSRAGARASAEIASKQQRGI